MESASYELMNALKTLLEIGKYSDLTILCGSKKYAVHRAIICSRSGFFDGACSNPFREAETGVIDLSEDDPEAVDHMVHYFYHLDYLSTPKTRSRATSSNSRPSLPQTPICDRSMSPLSPMSMSPTSSTFSRRSNRINLALVEDPLLATAAHYPTAPQSPLTPTDFSFSSMALPGKTPPEKEAHEEDQFEEFNADTFEAVPEQEPNLSQPHLLTHAKVYAIAEKYGIRALKALAQKKFAAQSAYHWGSTEFAEAIQEAYETTIDTDRGLRDIVIQTFRCFPEIAQRKDIEAIVRETPGLAWELFRVGWGLPI